MENWFCCKEWKIELLQFRFLIFIGNIHLLFLFALFLEVNQLRRHISVQYFFNGMIYYEKKQANCFFYRLVISDDAVNSFPHTPAVTEGIHFSYTCIHIRNLAKKTQKQSAERLLCVILVIHENVKEIYLEKHTLVTAVRFACLPYV